jgi:hypothetical protein
MHPNPQHLGARFSTGPEATPAHDMTVQLDDEELSTARQETRPDIGKIGKAGRRRDRRRQRDRYPRVRRLTDVRQRVQRPQQRQMCGRAGFDLLRKRVLLA